jgi:hypothetical protein
VRMTRGLVSDIDTRRLDAGVSEWSRSEASGGFPESAFIRPAWIPSQACWHARDVS